MRRHGVDIEKSPLTTGKHRENGGNSCVDKGGALRASARPGPKPRKRKAQQRAKGETTKQLQLELLLKSVTKSPDARDTVKAMLAAHRTPHVWRGIVATPPGTLLETVIRAFQLRTDFPLEIPFFATLHFVAAWLLRRGVVVEFAGRDLRPDLWTVILAPSGAGKTWVTNFLEPILGIEADFPEPASAAKFVADLAVHNHGLWIRDEFAQLLRGIEQQPHLAELRDYLLRVYDGRQVSRRTKADEIVVDDPALVILGLTVLEAFGQHVTPESMVDGFAQRFGFVIARRDLNRDPRDFPIYDLRGEDERIRKAWKRVSASTANRFVVSADGEAAFRDAFSALMPSADEVPLSFYRRILFRAVRYALLYHILLGRPGADVDAEDMGWAARVCWLHLQDAAELIADHGLPDLERVLRAAEGVRSRISANGEQLTVRRLIQGVHGIRSAAEARAVLSLLS